MATRTLGTNGTTTLTAIPFPDWTAASPAVQQQDFAAICALIQDDLPNSFILPATPGNVALPRYVPNGATPQFFPPTALSPNGVLYVPNRGYLKVLPGDWIGVDATGWPILLSQRAIIGVTTDAPTSWTHSGNSQ
jgi:hypothetical protein